jgi:hypothetical protein
MKKINEAWLKGLKGPEREKMKEEVLSSENFLDIAREMLYNMQERKREGAVLGDYDTPSWSHKQAHLNGELAMLAKLIEIFTVNERDDNPLK